MSCNSDSNSELCCGSVNRQGSKTFGICTNYKSDETKGEACPGDGDSGEEKFNDCAEASHLTNCCALEEPPQEIKSGTTISTNDCESNPMPQISVQEPAVTPSTACSLEPGQDKCLPIPASEFSVCVPHWICAQLGNSNCEYSIPPELEIRCISVGGRDSSKESEISTCASDSKIGPVSACQDVSIVRPGTQSASTSVTSTKYSRSYMLPLGKSPFPTRLLPMNFLLPPIEHENKGSGYQIQIDQEPIQPTPDTGDKNQDKEIKVEESPSPMSEKSEGSPEVAQILEDKNEQSHEETANGEIAPDLTEEVEKSCELAQTSDLTEIAKKSSSVESMPTAKYEDQPEIQEITLDLRKTVEKWLIEPMQNSKDEEQSEIVEIPPKMTEIAERSSAVEPMPNAKDEDQPETEEIPPDMTGTVKKLSTVEPMSNTKDEKQPEIDEIPPETNLVNQKSDELFPQDLPVSEKPSKVLENVSEGDKPKIDMKPEKSYTKVVDSLCTAVEELLVQVATRASRNLAKDNNEDSPLLTAKSVLLDPLVAAIAKIENNVQRHQEAKIEFSKSLITSEKKKSHDANAEKLMAEKGAGKISAKTRRSLRNIPQSNQKRSRPVKKSDKNGNTVQKLPNASLESEKTNNKIRMDSGPEILNRPKTARGFPLEIPDRIETATDLPPLIRKLSEFKISDYLPEFSNRSEPQPVDPRPDSPQLLGRSEFQLDGNRSRIPRRSQVHIPKADTFRGRPEIPERKTKLVIQGLDGNLPPVPKRVNARSRPETAHPRQMNNNPKSYSNIPIPARSRPTTVNPTSQKHSGTGQRSFPMYTSHSHPKQLEIIPTPNNPFISMRKDGQPSKLSCNFRARPYNSAFAMPTIVPRPRSRPKQSWAETSRSRSRQSNTNPVSSSMCTQTTMIFNPDVNPSGLDGPKLADLSNKDGPTIQNVGKETVGIFSKIGSMFGIRADAKK